jgi:WD40 repeat protein
MLTHPLQIAEYVFIAGSVIGLVMAVVTGKFTYAAVPLSVYLLLNLVNRLRFEQRIRRRITGAINQLHRQFLDESHSLYEQQLRQAIAQAIVSLKAQLPQYLSQLDISDGESSNLNIIQLKGQLTTLEQSLSSVVQYLNSSSLPARVEHLENAIASVTAEITQLHRQPPNTWENRIDELERRLQAYQPQQTTRRNRASKGSEVSFLERGHDASSTLPTSPADEPKNLPPAVSESSLFPISQEPVPVTAQNLPSSPPTWNHLHTLTGHTDWVRALAISPDGKILASGSLDKTIKLWKLPSGRLIDTLSRHSKGVLCIAISPDGQLLASGSFDETIKLWELNTGRLVQTLTGHTASVRSLAITSDGEILVSGSFDETIKLWDLYRRECLSTVAENAGAVSAIALTPDGQTLASGGIDGIITLRQLYTSQVGSQPPATLTLTGNLSSIGTLAISPDSETLAAGCTDGDVKLWQLSNGELLGVLAGHTGPVLSAVFSSDAQILSSGSADGTIRIWDLRTGEQLSVLTKDSASSVMSVAISPNGQLIAGGGADNTVNIWQRH